MRTRYPRCVECSNPIDPTDDKFRITNKDQAKYGEAPLYAHEVCPASLNDTEDESGADLEDAVVTADFTSPGEESFVDPEKY